MSNEDSGQDTTRRRTYCQVDFKDISEKASTGKKSVELLVSFLNSKGHAEEKFSKLLLKCLKGDTSCYEEQDTTIQAALEGIKEYIRTLSNQQETHFRAAFDQVSDPLVSLQKASDAYVHTLEDELKRVNDLHYEAGATLKKAKSKKSKLEEELRNFKEKHDTILKDTSLPEFEVNRVKGKLKKSKEDFASAQQEVQKAKNYLLETIINRDEMLMAVSVAYQKAEEERIDQIAQCLKQFIHIEQQQLRAREKILSTLQTKVEEIDRDSDIQKFINGRWKPDNLHFQGKALALLDWDWLRKSIFDEETKIIHEQNSIRKSEGEQQIEGDEERDDDVQEEKSDKGALPDNFSLTEIEMHALLSQFFRDSKEIAPSLPSSLSSSLPPLPPPPPQSVWEGDPIKGIATLCASQNGRECFLKTLNRQRSLVKDVGKGFGGLVLSFFKFLDCCVETNDVKCAKTAMIMAETFYKVQRTSKGTLRRVYLQNRVREHRIWKRHKFWEEALLLAISEELEKAPQNVPWDDLPSGDNVEEGTPSRKEAVCRVHNIVFGQLGSFTLSMLEFGVSVSQIRNFLETMCDAHELSEDQKFMLKEHLVIMSRDHLIEQSDADEVTI